MASEDSPFSCNICFETATDAVVTLCGHLYCWGCLYRWLRSGHNVCPVCKAGVSRENVIPVFTRGGSHSANADASSAPSARAGRESEAAPAAAAAGGSGAPQEASEGGSRSDRDGSLGGSEASSAEPSMPRRRVASGSADAGEEAGGHGDGNAGVPRRPPAQRPEAPDPVYGRGGGGAGGTGGNGGVSFSAGFGFFPSLFGLQFSTFNMPSGAGPQAHATGRPGNTGERQLTPEEEQQLFLSRALFIAGTVIIGFLMIL